MIQTDVLIIGSGPAGSAAALLLATYGVKTLVATKFNWTCRTPRAHITNQRTMEVLRDAGIEEEVNAKRAAQHLMGNNVFCTSLAGEELGRLYSWGNHPRRMADYTLASPTTICDIPQDLLEPVLFGNACARGSRPRMDTEYLSLEQDADGVTATVRDRLSGKTYPIRAKYLIGADGGRSQVAEDIGLPMHGKMGVAGSMNIVFEADLSRYVAHRPSVLYWVLQPGANIGGIGMGLVRMVRPWNKWLIVWGYDINGPAPEMNDELAATIARNLIGDQSIPIKVVSHSLWTVNHMYALSNTVGRVFCMGDAVHRHPPSNGLGSNTSVQDAYNLAWKLALVLQGGAPETLLDSYEAERRPVGADVVARTRAASEGYGRERGGTPDRLADTQIRVSYRGTGWVRDDAEGLDPKVPAAGDRAPDVVGLRRHALGFPLRLFDVLRGTEHVLVVHLAKADMSRGAVDLAACARELRLRFGARLRIVAVTAAGSVPDLPEIAFLADPHGTFADAYGAEGASFLVRPDGYIGWRGRSWRDTGLRAHLDRIFQTCVAEI